MRPVQGGELEPWAGGRVGGGHSQVVQHEVQQLTGAIDFGEQLEYVRSERIALQVTMMIVLFLYLYNVYEP